MNTEIGSLLAEIRSSSGFTQRQVAEKMTANQTRVSRIEAGESDADDTALFLQAIGTPKALEFANLIKFEWTHLPRPSFRHPDIETLVAVERGLEKIRTFLADGQVPVVLAGQAGLLERRLEEAGRYLLSLDHDVVYVGEIGVGKTTAVCRQANLVLDESTAADLKGMILDTGGGRTTLCDVRVEMGERFALTVEPVSDEEIYKLVAEVCRGIHEKLFGQASPAAQEFKPAEEVERALRNMAGLPRPPRPRKGPPSAIDPAVELAGKFTKLEDFNAEFAARLSLWRRSRRAIEFDGGDLKQGRQWLNGNFTAINNGRHEDFSLPNRITVTVPFSLVPDKRFSIAVIDTRGVDGSAVRPDILTHLKDSRAITLLCSKWGSAPDPSAQNLLVHIHETDADPTLFDRVAVVALARVGDALSMRHDSGESAETVAEGYDIKLGQVEDALQKIGLTGIEAIAFDSSTDEPADLISFILDKIASVRKTQADAAVETISTIDQMISNREEAQALAALKAVNDSIMRFADRHNKLPKARRRAHERLLTAVSELIHPRTVWAATRRAGRFWNFDVFQYLGDGAAADAKVRASQVIAGLIEILESDLSNPELVGAQGFLTQVRANAPQWEADFVNAARHHAAAVYQEPLGRARELWEACEADYGTGGGYCNGVAKRLAGWFEENEELQDELSRRIARAWKRSVILPLKRAAGSPGPIGDGTDQSES